MKILFVHQKLHSFVERDLRVLKEAHEVRELQFRGLRDLPALWNAAQWSQLTFSWFGSLHAFFTVLFSRMLGKKGVVVAGGYDVARMPEVGYGLLSTTRKAWCPRYVFHNADLVLAVSRTATQDAIHNAGADPARVRLVYHGFDDAEYRPNRQISREEAVITVGRVTPETVVVKGLNIFVGSAAYLPSVPFHLVGPNEDGAFDRLRKSAPPNVHFWGGVYGPELIKMYSRARVYVQASLHESFGCSVAEAMLCGCAPVVSKRGALPEVVGDAGIYVEPLEAEVLAQRIDEALHSPLGTQARARIQENFPLQKRRKELLRSISELGEC